MTLLPTKFIKLDNKPFQARMGRARDDSAVLVVDRLGPISPGEFALYGFKVVDATEQEIEWLEDNGYRDHGRFLPGF